jgi:thiosulfate reductase cytochrome b subunit
MGDSQAHAVPFVGCDLWFDAARVWHFWLMWVFILFVVPHVILVFADGWDTFRGMITGWSARVQPPEVTANE